jgi:putative transposase
VVPSLKPHRAQHARLVRLSRSLSRKQNGSANRAKAKAKLARLHLSIANVRKDALHKLTTSLATRFDIIAIEDLNVSGMVKNRCLARSIPMPIMSRRSVINRTGRTRFCIERIS